MGTDQWWVLDNSTATSGSETMAVAVRPRSVEVSDACIHSSRLGRARRIWFGEQAVDPAHEGHRLGPGSGVQVSDRRTRQEILDGVPAGDPRPLGCVDGDDRVDYRPEVKHHRTTAKHSSNSLEVPSGHVVQLQHGSIAGHPERLLAEQSHIKATWVNTCYPLRWLGGRSLSCIHARHGASARDADIATQTHSFSLARSARPWLTTPLGGRTRQALDADPVTKVLEHLSYVA
jgi:hypothetical protein